MIYYPPSLQGFVNQRAVFSTWTDHVPFGYDLVVALQPRVVVELGSQGGMSYFAFCQAVREHGLSSRCFAVDTWAGDSHTGEYDDSVYQDVAQHNAAHYSDFSELLRMRFEEAVDRFDDESIQLLHIDGFHTYEAVRGDFETWYPKVAPGGVVLFHDIAARLADFGVWRFWEEVSSRFPSFAFRHGFGLGVLRKPGGELPEAPLLKLLFSNDEETAARLRAFYVHAASHVDVLRRRDAVEKLKESVRRKRMQEASGS